MGKIEELIAAVQNQRAAIEKVIDVFQHHDLSREEIRWVLEYFLRILDEADASEDAA